MLQLSPLLRSWFSAAILLAGYASLGLVASSSRPGWDAVFRASEVSPPDGILILSPKNRAAR
jgi:hypothetical protein